MRTFHGNKFPYPKINRPKIDADYEMKSRIEKTFDDLDNYMNLVDKFIFTDIKLLYDEGDERINLSRVQQIISGALLRSLYLRNGIVDSINSRNMVSIFTNLKSFMEVPALLAFLYSKIESKISEKDFLDELRKIAMGNKGDVELRINNISVPNILTMFEKLDNYIKKMSEDDSNKNTATPFGSVMKYFYGIVCNVAHPNYDAHDVVGLLNYEKDQWQGLEPSIIKDRVITEFNWYSPSLNMTVTMIKYLSNSITDHQRINNFEKLNSSYYFDI